MQSDIFLYEIFTLNEKFQMQDSINQITKLNILK